VRETKPRSKIPGGNHNNCAANDYCGFLHFYSVECAIATFRIPARQDFSAHFQVQALLNAFSLTKRLRDRKPTGLSSNKTARNAASGEANQGR